MPFKTTRGPQDSLTGQHILLGLGVAATAVAGAALVARLLAAPETPESYTDYEDPYAPAPKPQPTLLRAVWAPLLVALGSAGAYLLRAEARRPETSPPRAGWRDFAATLGGELRRRAGSSPTVH